jgi:hypothetical protein
VSREIGTHKCTVNRERQGEKKRRGRGKRQKITRRGKSGQALLGETYFSIVIVFVSP